MEGHAASLDLTGALPQRLKSATRALHARAERSGVMAALLACAASRGAYVALLANLHAIYAALEPPLEAGPMSAPLFGVLARRAALEADLRAFGTPPPLPVPATLDYASRLRTLTGTSAHRLWAHVYVRYLGDLHGGQILSDRVHRLFAVPGGTHFYDFGDDARVHALRAELRARLATLELEPAQAEDVVAEAVWAFEAHCRIFEEIRATT